MIFAMAALSASQTQPLCVTVFGGHFGCFEQAQPVVLRVPNVGKAEQWWAVRWGGGGGDAVAGHLRALVARCRHVQEDDRAERGATTLSFRSVKVPERHVWIDTDLGGDIVVDLEDWTTEERWDNAVAHVKAEAAEAAAELIVQWLGGSDLEDGLVFGCGPADLM